MACLVCVWSPLLCGKSPKIYIKAVLLKLARTFKPPWGSCLKKCRFRLSGTGWTWNSLFLTSFQLVQILLIQRPHFEQQDTEGLYDQNPAFPHFLWYHSYCVSYCLCWLLFGTFYLLFLACLYFTHLCCWPFCHLGLLSLLAFSSTLLSVWLCSLE